MNPKLPFLNKKYTLELKDSLSIQGQKWSRKKISFEIYLGIPPSVIKENLNFSEFNHNIFTMTELYCAEKHLLPEWKEFGLWNNYPEIQFDSISDNDMVFQPMGDDIPSVDQSELFKLMKYFINGSYKNEECLETTYPTTSNGLEFGVKIWTSFPWHLPFVMSNTFSFMNEISMNHIKNLYVKSIYEGLKPPIPTYNELVEIDKRLDGLVKKVEKKFQKEIIQSNKKLFSNKLKKKKCSDALEQINNDKTSDFVCDNPNKNKRFKNCCFKRVMTEYFIDDKDRFTKSYHRQIFDIFTEKLGIEHEKRKNYTPFKPLTKRTSKYDDIIKELFEIEQRPTSYTKKNFIDKKKMYLEHWYLFNDYHYKNLEHLYKYREEYQEMVGAVYFGALINFHQMRMTLQSNRIENGLQNKSIKPSWTIEKLYRYCSEDSKRKEGMEYQIDIKKQFQRIGIIYKLIDPSVDVDGDTEMTIYRGVQRVRHWVGHSWTTEISEAQFFIKQTLLKGENGQLVDEWDDQDKKGYLCELKVKRKEILTRRIRGSSDEQESVMVKKDLNKDNLKVWEVECPLDPLGNKDTIKIIRQLDDSEISDNPFWNTDTLPDYY